jgi:hypothetical protein
MLIVSVSFQNYHNGAVSNQLTDVGRGGGIECVEGDIESVDALKVILYIPQSNNVSTTSQHTTGPIK